MWKIQWSRGINLHDYSGWKGVYSKVIGYASTSFWGAWDNKDIGRNKQQWRVRVCMSYNIV